MGKKEAHFNRKTPFRAVAARVLTERLDALMEHEAGTRAGTDPEDVHDMRVASRRLRAALEAFGVCYHGKRFRRIAKETKALTDALGGVRDSDVLLARMAVYAESVPPDEQPAIAAFIRRIEAERDAHRTAMLRALDDLAASRYAERFRVVATHPDV